MHHETHHRDTSAEVAGAASWLVATVLFVVLSVGVSIVLFAWAPWDDDGVGGGTSTDTEENIDINVDDVEQAQPSDSP